MTQSTTAPERRTSDPIAMRAARIASLATAANLVLTGSSLCNTSATETIVIDLLDVAGIMAAQLAVDTEAAVYHITQGA